MGSTGLGNAIAAEVRAACVPATGACAARMMGLMGGAAAGGSLADSDGATGGRGFGSSALAALNALAAVTALGALSGSAWCGGAGGPTGCGGGGGTGAFANAGVCGLGG